MLGPSAWVQARESNPCPGPPDCTSRFESCGMVRRTGWFVVLVQVWWWSAGLLMGSAMWLSPFQFYWLPFSLPLCLPSLSSFLQDKQPTPNYFFSMLVPAFLHPDPNLLCLIMAFSNPGLIWHYWQLPGHCWPCNIPQQDSSTILQLTVKLGCVWLSTAS